MTVMPIRDIFRESASPFLHIGAVYGILVSVEITLRVALIFEYCWQR
jgi:hypothetical protein